MKRRVLIAVLVLIVAFFGIRELKDIAVEWYADNYYQRQTAYPSGEAPDQIVLTWPGDPRTRIAVNWRTAPTIEEGRVEYRRADAVGTPEVLPATYAAVEDELLENDPLVHRFTAVIDGLEPATTYAYRVAAGEDAWSEWHTFTTAPGEAQPFSFIYLGDAQKGLEEWGALMTTTREEAPHAAFYILAGDLVNDNDWRDEWDLLFAGAAGVLEETPFVPALGNHDVNDDESAPIYLASFALPADGPPELEPERAYSFNYGNALFVVLDSNLPPASQRDWLEKTLAASDEVWKFVVFHHPAYTSKPKRRNPEVLEEWVPLFDRYGVDMAFQGHDHAYLRTHPMRGGEPVAAPEDGTIYVVATSGTKFYEQDQHDYTAVGFVETQTYQVIDIETDPHRLVYRAYDLEGELRDEVVIEKEAPVAAAATAR